MLNLNDPSDPKQAKVFRWLEDVLYLVDIPVEARPGNYNSQKVNNLTDASVPHDEKVRMVKRLSDASELAWQSICGMDSTSLGHALSETMQAWGEMLPYTLDPYQHEDHAKSKILRDFWMQYDAPHTKGCLFTGAGGGFLMVISDTPIAEGMKIQINHDHYCKPFASDSLGSTAHDVPFSV